MRGRLSNQTTGISTVVEALGVDQIVFFLHRNDEALEGKTLYEIRKGADIVVRVFLEYLDAQLGDEFPHVANHRAQYPEGQFRSNVLPVPDFAVKMYYFVFTSDHPPDIITAINLFLIVHRSRPAYWKEFLEERGDIRSLFALPTELHRQGTGGGTRTHDPKVMDQKEWHPYPQGSLLLPVSLGFVNRINTT